MRLALVSVEGIVVRNGISGQPVSAKGVLDGRGV